MAGQNHEHSATPVPYDSVPLYVLSWQIPPKFLTGLTGLGLSQKPARRRQDADFSHTAKRSPYVISIPKNPVNPVNPVKTRFIFLSSVFFAFFRGKTPFVKIRAVRVSLPISIRVLDLSFPLSQFLL